MPDLRVLWSVEHVEPKPHKDPSVVAEELFSVWKSRTIGPGEFLKATQGLDEEEQLALDTLMSEYIMKTMGLDFP